MKKLRFWQIVKMMIQTDKEFFLYKCIFIKIHSHVNKVSLNSKNRQIYIEKLGNNSGILATDSGYDSKVFFYVESDFDLMRLETKL